MFNLFSKGKGKKAADAKKRGKSKPAKGKKAAAKKASSNKKAKQSDENPFDRLKQNPVPAPAQSREFLSDLPPTEAEPDAFARLDAAKSALDAGTKVGKLPAGGRQKLIQQALAVHNVQSKLLDDLDEGTKQKLRELALQKLVMERNK